MAPASPFKIAVPEDSLTLLRKKLDLTIFPDELEASHWNYGAPLADIKRLAEFWRTSYDWRKQEATLNKLPQYTIPIQIPDFDTLEIHFVHQRSARSNAIPLLFVHGWPGSFVEVTKIIESLTEGSDTTPAFHIVAPSLPNYGFSEGVKKKGFGIRQHAATCNALMQKLGYSKYATQGGDWGYMITRCVGSQYPDNCRASHINGAVPSAPRYKSQPLLALQQALTPFSKRDIAGLAKSAWFRKEGMGYFTQQATKPQTIGYSQSDSPVGLLAWIYEKLHDWTDSYPWRDDEILTWVSIYWFSRAGPTASSRTYYEARHGSDKFNAADWVSQVKLGLSLFPQEILSAPKLWHHTMGPVVFLREHERGGHFAAWERPDAIINDLRAMFGRQGGAFAAVEGCTGYENLIRSSL